MPSKTILDCDKALQKAWNAIIGYLKKSHPHYHLRIVETHVPPEEQKDLFNLGRNGLGEVTGDGSHTVTDFDGTVRVTLFNYYPSRAVRFILWDDRGGQVWPADVYRIIENIAHTNHLGFEAPDVMYKL